jgi:hypothetical protein
MEARHPENNDRDRRCRFGDQPSAMGLRLSLRSTRRKQTYQREVRSQRIQQRFAPETFYD